jgi:hypothetical protein
MAGVNRPGDTVDLYFGTQDVGAWATTNAQDTAPQWSDQLPSDSFTIVADANFVVWYGDVLRRDNPGMTGGSQINTHNDLPLVRFRFANAIDQYAAKKYVVIAERWDLNGNGTTENNERGGVFVTQDITATPVVWDRLGPPETPAGACGVRASVDPGTGAPTFYVQAAGANTSSCNQHIYDRFGDHLFKYVGDGPSSNWDQLDDNPGMMAGGIGIFGVDPKDPDRLYASNLAGGGPRMVFSTDGGDQWSGDPELDEMMTGGGTFRYVTERGPANDTGFGNLQDFWVAGRRVGFFAGYPQPSLVAFDPEDPNILVAGGRDSGVFLSTNGGEDWGLLTDPFDSGNSGIPHIPRPWFAHFHHDSAGIIWVYLGTQGRGVWRIRIRLPVANAGGPYVTAEGTDVELDASASSDPDGRPLTFAWDLDNDGVLDDASGPKPIFDRVGQDGVFTARVKVTAGAAFAVDSTTVTVNNVAPAIASLSSDSPKPENTPILVSGEITDPGWLENLTATFDWDDGTPLETVSGTLENVRPDATLAFSVSHTYGDNGTFNATVCASDDDATTCQQIALQVNNVDPTAEIDETNTTLINGIPTFLAHAGEPVEFSGHSTDPGSDDLFLSWDWDDGPPSPDVTTVYLVNPAIGPDPFPSPSIQPRDVMDMQTSAFDDACLYLISFLAEDDDGGSSFDQAYVLTTGNAEQTRSEGYWQHQFHQVGNTDFEDEELECYLEIIGFVSTVFNEVRDASTIEAAYDVLFLQGNQGSEAEQFDRELLTVWLNFANGAVAYDQLIDTDSDGVPDTQLAVLVAVAEGVRLDPLATPDELRDQTQILHLLWVQN